MTICIIIATRNTGAELPNCLDSILDQDLLPTSVIVQDGASTDNTVEILRSYEHRLGAILDWRSEPDCGIADAWNKALNRARGDWILFLGSDDVLYDPCTLSQVADNLKLLPKNIRVAYGRVELRKEDGVLLGVIGHDWRDSARSFRRCLETIPHQGTFHHRSLFAEFGIFDTNLKIGSDFEFLLRELMTNDAHFMSHPVISKMKAGGLSTSRSHILTLNTERIAIHKKHGRHLAPPSLYWRAFKALAIFTLYKIGGDEMALKLTNLYRKWIRLKPPLPR